MNDLEKCNLYFCGCTDTNFLVCIQQQFCHLRGPGDSNVRSKIRDFLAFKLANTSSHIGGEIINLPPCVFPKQLSQLENPDFCDILTS